MAQVTIVDEAVREMVRKREQDRTSNVPISTLFSSAGNRATVLAMAWIELIRANAIAPAELASRIRISVRRPGTVDINVAPTRVASGAGAAHGRGALAEGGSSSIAVRSGDVAMLGEAAAEKLRQVLDSPPDRPPMGNPPVG